MTRPRARPSASPTVSTARNGSSKSSPRSEPCARAAGATAAPVRDDEDGRVQVAKDARQVAVALLANKRRRAISPEAVAKVSATTLFLVTVSFSCGLIKQHAFLNRVRRSMEEEDVKREAHALVTEECASASDASANTMDVADDLARTRHAEHVRNPQPFFVQTVHAFSRGDVTAAEAVAELRRVGVRVTKAFMERARVALSFGDEIPHHSECEDGRGRPGALSEPYVKQLAKIVKHYIRQGIRLSQATILSIARNFYRDEHGSVAPPNALGPAWFYRFIEKNGIDSSLYNPLDALRANSATAHNVQNFFERVARTAVRYGFAVWNADFDVNSKLSEMIIWTESKMSRVFTLDEAKVQLAYEKGVRGVRLLMIRGEDNQRPAVTANDAFSASVMGCRNLAGEALAPYFVCTQEPDVADDFDIPGTIVDTTTGERQQAQWIRGTKKGSFDAYAFATYLRDHLAPCIPDLSKQNPAMVICDGAYTHVKDEVVELCAAMGILLVVLPPHCTHLLQGEDLYHFGVFKGSFRVIRAEIEAAKSLASSWFIQQVTHEGVAVSFGQSEFWYAVREAWKGAWTKEAVGKGLKMQGLVPFNRAPLWKHFPEHVRERSEQPDENADVLDAESRAERCAERISIPGAPGLRVIARSDNSSFNMTFDGSPESFARAPLNIETMKQVLENVNTVNIADDDRNIINQVFQDAINTITRKVVTTTRKKRKSRRYDHFDEVTEPVMARLAAERDKREKRKRTTHDAAKDTNDGRYKSNADAVDFVKALYERFESTGSLEMALTRKELMHVMRAKRIELPQAPDLEYLRNKLKEVDERLYEANLSAPSVRRRGKSKRPRQTPDTLDESVHGEVSCQEDTATVQLAGDDAAGQIVAE